MHYHGTPISPRAQLLRLAGRHFVVSFAEPRDLDVCLEIGQSVLADNGAYSIWKAGHGEIDVDAYAEWVRPILDRRENWCVIPDSVTAGECANDELVGRWLELGFDTRQSAPVWHMHDEIGRLRELAASFPRVCLGSSAQYASVGDARWHWRMRRAMDVLCGDGPAPVWLHMLRGMKMAGSEYPFASVDSASVGLNHAGNNTRATPPKDVIRMADEMDGRQGASRWRVHEQLEIGGAR